MIEYEASKMSVGQTVIIIQQQRQLIIPCDVELIQCDNYIFDEQIYLEGLAERSQLIPPL